MIDKADVERGLTTAEAMIADEYVKVSVLAEDYRDLLTDWLAMHAIVEALAAKNPIEWDEIEALDGRPSYYCRYCGSRNPSNDPESFIHIVTCEWCDARALVGPAGGESNSIEFDGVEEES